MASFVIGVPSEDEVRSGGLGRRMREFNYGYVGRYPETQSIWLSAYVDSGGLVGGLRGYVFMEWFHIDILFVEEDVRRMGIGRELLVEGERRAKALGAKHSKLETFEWQALGFYLKQGYEEFSRIDDFKAGFYLAYLKRAL